MESGDDTTRAAVEVLSVNSIPSELGFAFGESDMDSFLDSTTSSSSSAMPVYAETKKARVPARKEEEVPEMSYELQQAYKILRDIMSESHKATNQPFLHAIDPASISDPADYYEVIQNPMWLMKIKENLFSLRYKSITEFVCDMRLLLENCYRYFGPDSPITKKGIKLEVMMEQKLALLPREFREKTTLEATSGKSMEEWGGTRRKSNRFGATDTSLILNHVRHEKGLRDKELRRRQMEERKAEKEEKEKGIIEWEDGLLEEPLCTQLKTAWELPQIGLFLFLCQGPLNTPEVPQYELERILVMPRESNLLCKIMTSLLSSPRIRPQLDRKMSMPYKVWTEKLAAKVEIWYRALAAKENNVQKVFEQIGIEPEFFKIVGSTNPLEENQFHELSFQQRIWLLKSLCDYIMHNHKTVQDAINEQLIADQRDYYLGEDELGNRYLHFPQFCGQNLRIYRQGRWKAPALDLPMSIIAEVRSTKKNRKKKKPEKTPSRKSKEEASRPKKSVSLPVQHARPSHLRQTLKPVIKPVEVKADSSASEDLTEEEEATESEDEQSEHEMVEGKEEPTFELIVDSVEALRQLINHLAEDIAKRKKKSSKSRKSFGASQTAALHEHLCNLLAELEPWEIKLLQATSRLRKKLHKEWHDHQMKRGHHEEAMEDIWSSDEDEAAQENNQDISADVSMKEESSSSETSTSSDEEEAPPLSSAVSATAARKRRVELMNTSNIMTDDEEEEIADKQRKPMPQPSKTKDVNRTAAKRKRTEDIRLPNGATKGLLISHSQQNTASQARELYAWETLRQILVSPQKKRSPSPPVEYPKGTSSGLPAPVANVYQTAIRNLISGPQRLGLKNDTDSSSEEMNFEDDCKVPASQSSSASIETGDEETSMWLECHDQESSKPDISSYSSNPMLSSTLIKNTLPGSSNSTTTVATMNRKVEVQPLLGVSARRQTNLMIGIPSQELTAISSGALFQSPTPSIETSVTPSSASLQLTTALPQATKNAVASGEPVLTPATNSGTPKILANIAGANAQFMHLKLGSPTSKKNIRLTPTPITPTHTPPVIQASPQALSQASGPKPPEQQQQTVLLIPAVDDKGNTVYFKVVSSAPAATITTSTPLHQTCPVGQQQQLGKSPMTATSVAFPVPNFNVSAVASQVSPVVLKTENKWTTAPVQDQKVPFNKTVVPATRLLQSQMPLHVMQNVATSMDGKSSVPYPSATTSTVASLSTLCSIFPPKLSGASTVGVTRSDNAQQFSGVQTVTAQRIAVAKPKGSFVILSQPPPLGPICSVPKSVAPNQEAQKRPKLAFQVLTQPPPLAQIGSGAKTTPTTVLTIPQPTSTIQAPLVRTNAMPNTSKSPFLSLQRPAVVGQVLPGQATLRVDSAASRVIAGGQLFLKQPSAVKSVALSASNPCNTLAANEGIHTSQIVVTSLPSGQLKQTKTAAVLLSPTKVSSVSLKAPQSISAPSSLGIGGACLAQSVVLSQPALTNHVQPVAQQVCTILPQNLSSGQTILISPPTMPVQKKIVGSPVLQPLVQSVKPSTISNSSYKHSVVNKEPRAVMVQQLNLANTAASVAVTTSATPSGSTVLLNMPSTGSPSRLVMIQNGQTQSLGLLTENGQIVPINLATNPSSAQMLPLNIANSAVGATNQAVQARQNSFLTGSNIAVVLNSSTPSNLNACGTSQGTRGVLMTKKSNFATVSTHSQLTASQLINETQTIARGLNTGTPHAIVTTSNGTDTKTS